MKQIFKTQSIFGFLLLCFSNNRDNIQTLGINELHINDLILHALQQTQSLALIDHIEIIYPDLRFEEKDPIFKTHNNQKWPYIKPYFYFVLMMVGFQICDNLFQESILMYRNKFIINESFPNLNILLIICIFGFRFIYIKNDNTPIFLSLYYFLLAFVKLIPVTFFFINIFSVICFIEKHVKIKLVEDTLKDEVADKLEYEEREIEDEKDSRTTQTEEKVKPTKLAKILLLTCFLFLIVGFFVLKHKKIIEKIFFLFPDLIVFCIFLFIIIFPQNFNKMQIYERYFNHKISLYDLDNKKIKIGAVLCTKKPLNSKKKSYIIVYCITNIEEFYFLSHFLRHKVLSEQIVQEEVQKHLWYKNFDYFVEDKRMANTSCVLLELKKTTKTTKDNNCAALVISAGEKKTKKEFSFRYILYDKKVYKGQKEKQVDRYGDYIEE